MLYVAYGSNMNLEQMVYRCPTAKKVGVSVLKGYELTFRGRNGNCHATIDACAGGEVPVVIWEIDAYSERALDLYEGYPNYYRKEYVKVDGKECMVYVMNPNKKGYPSSRYLDCIAKGYEDNGIDLAPLDEAVQKIIKEVGLCGAI